MKNTLVNLYKFYLKVDKVMDNNRHKHVTKQSPHIA